AVVACLGGCATRPPREQYAARALFDEKNDRLEPLNRRLFAIDRFVEAAIVRPLVWSYTTVLPRPLRESFSAFLANLRSPVILANDLLEGELANAGRTAARFGVNTTVGLGGFFDVATQLSIEGHYTDFGITLALWGVREGGYSFTPLLGPSSTRDMIGRVIDTFALDPLAWYSYNPGNEQWALGAELGAMFIDTEASVMPAVEEMATSSIDYYAVLRSAYRQRRNHQIGIIRPAAAAPLPPLELEEGFGDARAREPF
ncbi:MAG: MlaA family lipoprotein, partial [Rhodospirillaceae bacterium]